MKRKEHWKSLGWDHPLWDLLRYYRSLRTTEQKRAFVENLNRTGVIMTDARAGFPVAPADVRLLDEYLAEAGTDRQAALESLRTEDEAKDHCNRLGAFAGQTRTQNQEHHQSSKALVSAVSRIAENICRVRALGIDWNPQRRCVWNNESGLHVSARNLDGAVPGLLNPSIIWEIKEYWGVTSGGSKMSDAVYECHLVGRELRDFEKRTGIQVIHIVFLDGKAQWGARKSDMMRFVDLFHQGLIDELLIGRDVENDWDPLLTRLIDTVVGAASDILVRNINDVPRLL